MIPAQMQIPGLDLSASLHNTATEVLCLMNMVEIEELMDDEEYEGTERFLSTKTVTFSCIKVSAERLTRLEIKWNGPFRFGPTGTLETTFEGSPLDRSGHFGRSDQNFPYHFANCCPQYRSSVYCLQEQ